jgi:hypothetical protein
VTYLYHKTVMVIDGLTAIVRENMGAIKYRGVLDIPMCDIPLQCGCMTIVW